MDTLLKTLLDLFNEMLTAAIVIIAASFLLYNLTRNLTDRVARTSSILLACVTVVYLGDAFVSLEPSPGVYAATLRIQWIGIAFAPAALFHLSDALLATTGLPSRGRRRRVVRALYLLSAVFLLLAAFTDSLIQTVPVNNARFVSVRGTPLFALYGAYFVIAALIAFNNVQRARQRCLTRGTRRRMGYLQVAMLTPSLGIFPFGILLGAGQELTLASLLLVNVANIVVIFMLLFLSYPLSFFGSRVPDRVVKVELLRFFLRGPGTGLLALATVLYVPPASSLFSLPGRSLLPFVVVAVVLLWQWIVALALPYLERRLVYPNEDGERLTQLQSLADRLLTRGDLLQLLEAILAAACDYLRVSSAFVATLNGGAPEVIAAVGSSRPTAALLKDEADTLRTMFDGERGIVLHAWHTFWVISLYRRRGENGDVFGVVGIQARSAEVNLSGDEWRQLEVFVRRLAQTLDDLLLQGDILAALEGLLPQMHTAPRTPEIEYKPGHAARQPSANDDASALNIDREQFIEQVRAALNHYWGGPGLTSSRLLELVVVRQLLPDNDNNPARALRAALQRAIEAQRPEGERKLTSPEWTVYNILELRFLQRLKVQEVADRIARSEADFHRKRNVAIEAVADTLLKLEREALERLPT